MDERRTQTPGPQTPGPQTTGPLRVIDCDDCVMSGSSACRDCVVSFVVGREPGDALVVDADEERALRLLGGEGLVPTLRHLPRRTG